MRTSRKIIFVLWIGVAFVPAAIWVRSCWKRDLVCLPAGRSGLIGMVSRRGHVAICFKTSHILPEFRGSAAHVSEALDPPGLLPASAGGFGIWDPWSDWTELCTLGDEFPRRIYSSSRSICGVTVVRTRLEIVYSDVYSMPRLHVVNGVHLMPPDGYFVVVPLLLPVALGALLVLCFVARSYLRRRERAPNLCSWCGYDLRSTPQRCPECGLRPPPMKGSE
ncbi:MAG TPA: hypothetical protein VFE47_30690 [Tepidisphaeraceae bacterium]|jgi:hypothetical protein|nr:hypothetical protein [Tepidisphaeraceae bacterium]